MTNPVLLITGASRGLGAATARIAASLGAQVALLARSSKAIHTLAGEIQSAGGKALPLAGDVSQMEDCRRVIADILSHFGRLDGIVNNAGILGPMAPLGESDLIAWHTSLKINLLGPAQLIQEGLPALRTSKGRVINVSSGAAVNVIRGWSAYCTAKAGLNHLTRVLAAEEPEVTFISFRPGVVDTEMQAQIRSEGAEGMPPEEHARFLKYHTRGDLNPPELPGRALVRLALSAPPSWSGEFIAWDDPRLQEIASLEEPAE